MRGFPKTIGCKQDLVNLEKDFPKEVAEYLERIKEHDEATVKVVRVVSGSKEKNDLVTETIDNPSPIHKRLGFKDLSEVSDRLESVKRVRKEDVNGK